MPAEPMDLSFPLRGINEGWAFGRQPEGTTPDCSNVIPFDTIDSRARGGQRWGTSKYFPTQHNGSEALQRLTSIASIALSGTDIAEPFTHADAPFWSAYPDTWDHFVYHRDTFFDSVVDADTESPEIVSNQIKWSYPTTDRYSVHVYTGKDYALTGDYSISFDIKCTGTQATNCSPSVLFRANPAYTGECYYVEFYCQFSAGANTARVMGYFKKHDGSGRTNIDSFTTGISAGVYDALVAGTTFTVNITAAGVVGTDLGTVPYSPSDFTPAMDTYGEYHRVGFGQTAYFNDPVGTFNVHYVDNFTVTGIDPPSSGRSFDLVALSGGDIYTGKVDASLSLATAGENAVNTSGRVDMQAAYGVVYFADGDPAHYNLWTQSTDTASTWYTTAGTLPMGSDETAVSITAVNQGNKTFTVVEDWSARASKDRLLVAGSTGNDGYYRIASVSGSGPTILTVDAAIPDSDNNGTIQYQNYGCKINCLYRGRLVMAGLTSDPQNWFMSAAGNPLDWDYGATVSATMAVAGNNSDAGYCPDIITCLAPYSDDLMFIGGDHSLWLMRGDPADRGRIDNVSYQTGISGPDAFTFDPNGVFYFFGSGTLWRMTAGGVPEPLSRSRMDQTFSAISLATNTIHLAWDNIRHGLFIFVVPSAEDGASAHYYWDERTDSFWRIILPDAQGPTTTYAFDGDNPNDTALLLGGWGGYIRQIDPTAKNDDGTAISSYVLYPPITAGGPLKNVRIGQITTVLDTNSDDATLTAYAEDTVQKAIESSTIRFARTVSADRTKILQRVAGNAIMFKLSNETDEKTWAVESVTAAVEVTGFTRKNQL